MVAASIGRTPFSSAFGPVALDLKRKSALEAPARDPPPPLLSLRELTGRDNRCVPRRLPSGRRELVDRHRHVHPLHQLPKERVVAW